MKQTRLSIGILLIVAAGSVLATVGCGNSDFASVGGVVTLDGEPLADATVVFSSPGRPLATARTDPDGEFSMETGGMDGIKPGEYAVTVTAFQKSKRTGATIPKLSIPEKYSKPELSELTAVVVAGRNDDLQLTLQSQ